jgi:hypothetical protein
MEEGIGKLLNSLADNRKALKERDEEIARLKAANPKIATLENTPKATAVSDAQRRVLSSVVREKVAKRGLEASEEQHTIQVAHSNKASRTEDPEEMAERVRSSLHPLKQRFNFNPGQIERQKMEQAKEIERRLAMRQ